MFNLDVITNENNAERNSKWPNVPDHPYRILTIEGSRSWKTNALFNLIKEEDSDLLTGKNYLYAKDLNEPKYPLLIKKTRRCNKTFKWSKGIYRIFKHYGWYLQ